MLALPSCWLRFLTGGQSLKSEMVIMSSFLPEYFILYLIRMHSPRYRWHAAGLLYLCYTRMHSTSRFHMRS